MASDWRRDDKGGFSMSLEQGAGGGVQWIRRSVMHRRDVYVVPEMGPTITIEVEYVLTRTYPSKGSTVEKKPNF